MLFKLLRRLCVVGCVCALLSSRARPAAPDSHFAAVYGSSNPSDYTKTLDLARAKLEAGDPSTAQELAQELIVQRDRPELHILLGDCYEAMGKFQEAAAQYQIAARADPSEANLFSFASELLKYRGYTEAVQVLSYGTRQYPESARLRVALGVAEYSTGDYANAVRTFCDAVDLNPNDARPLEFLGKMAGVAPGLSRDVSARLKHFALEYPNNAAASYYYAMSLLASPQASDRGGDDSPKRFLQRAVALSPDFAQAHYQLGIVCEEDGDTSSAIREFEIAAKQDRTMGAAHYHLARLYQKTGRAALAAREFKAVKNLRAQ